MTGPGLVALVTPHEERRRAARAWAPLLAGRAEIHVTDSPRDGRAEHADLLLLDEECPELDAWLARTLAERDRPDSILVFGDEGETQRGALPWGPDGAQVLATVSDLLERRSLLVEADRLVLELRASTNRLGDERRRFADLVLTHAESMRAANVSLSREVVHLRRLQSIARFFAAPGPPDSFGDRFASVLGRAIDAAGVGLVRVDGADPAAEGLWRISARNALAHSPPAAAGAERDPSSPAPAGGRSGVRGTWRLLESLPSYGVVILPADHADAGSALTVEEMHECMALASEGLAARSAVEDAAQRRLQNDRMLRALRGGLLRIDAQDRVRLANPALATMLGAQSGSLEGRPLESVFARDPHLLEFFESIRDGSAAPDDVETYLTSLTGQTHSVSIRASLVPDSPGRGVEILALFFDLSRRKEVEAEVRRAERLAALGRLSAGVAHEIRNPLAGIRTTAELLKTRLPEGDERVRFTDVILEETHRLDRIVGSLLQFAKPAEPRMEPIDLGALLDRAAQLAEGKASEHRVRIRRSSPRSGPIPLADRDQILQVLLNLILNAIEATPAGGEVRVGAQGPTGGRSSSVTIRIEDGGEGVPSSIRDRVFDPFFTTKPGGTGLGLSISEHIVRRHGGAIRLEKPHGAAHAAVVTLASRPTPATSRGGSAWPAS